MTNLDDLRRDNPLPTVAEAEGVALEADGYEFKACCPFHGESTPSFTIFRGRKDNQWRFHCFGCDAKGDVIEFIQLLKGVSTGEAIRVLGGAFHAGPNVQPTAPAAVDIYAGIVPLDPPSELAIGRKVVLYNPKRERMGNIIPSLVHPYRRIDGSLIGYVLRHELPDGGKETPSVHWVRLPSGEECWSRYPFAKPRPIYGLHRIGGANQVIIVEGEKCADKLTEARGGKPALSWVGGTNGIDHTDWSPLAGRDVLVWPDNDVPGGIAALHLESILKGVASKVRLIDCVKGSQSA